MGIVQEYISRIGKDPLEARIIVMRVLIGVLGPRLEVMEDVTQIRVLLNGLVAKKAPLTEVLVTDLKRALLEIFRESKTGNKAIYENIILMKVSLILETELSLI